jgi:S-DNA-T family DNA segregation ATPase FtsK/SpoIIIE
MAKNTPRQNTYRTRPRELGQDFGQLFTAFLVNERIRLALGLCFLMTAFGLLVALSSYFSTGPQDQSVVEAVLSRKIKSSGAEVENWLGVSGAVVAHLLIFRWFGVAAFLLVPVCFLAGWKLAFKTEVFPIRRTLLLTLFVMFWTSLLLGYLYAESERVTFWSGGLGYEVASLVESLLGVGTILFILLVLVLFVINFFNINELSAQFNQRSEQFKDYLEQIREQAAQQQSQRQQADTQAKQATTHTDGLEPAEEVLDEQAYKRMPKTPKTFTPSDPHTIEIEPVAEEKAAPTRKTRKIDVELEINPDSQPPEQKQAKIPFEKVPVFEVNNLDDDEPPTHTEPPKDLSKTIILEDSPRRQQAIVDPAGDDEDKSWEEKSAIENTEPYDPRLDLGNYQFPTLELLEEHSSGKRQVTNEELSANKDRIVETLSNYGIGISQIKATIGPTVTLYEIIPEAGVRISKIKNLENDIALSLAALGIRIIAPIPGKGTIGIEVPNKRREIVGMRSILGDEAFLNSSKELPIVLGKTIANEVYVADLAKMPHLLMAGATGQGKSVGLNTFMISLLYKKHPSELKFVLVDPKKVELSLFNIIEKHFLAKLPNEAEAIITDNKKVVDTLTSLCMEMDNRYDLLKNAQCRNLREYNRKFTQRKLNPRKGHKYLPYIVLIIDELADLMMTAGKEVEQPIARLAQLARAVGIHLIVATQRPSVNVITGIIKANFPARLSFKVTSKIDSRTILDTGGAEQLVGMGDMLFTLGSEMTRLQGAFLDTPEVERVCEFIGQQQGYPSAYELPEVASDDNGADGADEGDYERDALFEDAARVIVMHQQGSTSLLQRRLKLGYNRAGRLIDQLEKAGIVGPYEGSKAREVLIPDEYTLERLLNSLK